MPPTRYRLLVMVRLLYFSCLTDRLEKEIAQEQGRINHLSRCAGHYILRFVDSSHENLAVTAMSGAGMFADDGRDDSLVGVGTDNFQSRFVATGKHVGFLLVMGFRGGYQVSVAAVGEDGHSVNAGGTQSVSHFVGHAGPDESRDQFHCGSLSDRVA
jgi:hypothetical protein